MSSQAELVLLEEAGLKPMQVLRAATTAAASMLGMEKELGALRPGALADLLILEADPRVSTRHVGALAWVVRDGRAYRPLQIPVAQ